MFQSWIVCPAQVVCMTLTRWHAKVVRWHRNELKFAEYQYWSTARPEASKLSAPACAADTHCKIERLKFKSITPYCLWNVIFCIKFGFLLYVTFSFSNNNKPYFAKKYKRTKGEQEIWNYYLSGRDSQWSKLSFHTFCQFRMGGNK